jgi:hypothetical protein
MKKVTLVALQPCVSQHDYETPEAFFRSVDKVVTTAMNALSEDQKKGPKVLDINT